MTVTTDTTSGSEIEDGSLTQQLYSFYEERELLQEKLGVSSAEEIIAMIDNLELQLRDFYEQGDES